MTDFSKLFGSNLVDAQGNSFDTNETLSGKDAVLIYFSAHWCGPCRATTPQLVEFYNKTAKAKNYEIVFASSDRDGASFGSYLSEMPWKAVPFSARDVKDRLSSKYKVQGIPTIVVLDGEGKLITANGRQHFVEDPEAAEFPWRPKPVFDLLPEFLVDKDGNKLAKDELRKGPWAIYFSAHWCPPCRAFSPVLGARYTQLQKEGKHFHIVFVSSDRDEGSFNEYLSELPFHAVPFADRAAARELGSRFEVQGIPALVILDGEGNIINKNGRAAISGDAPYPFEAQDVEILSGGTAGSINDMPCVVAFTGSDAAATVQAKEVFDQVAAVYKAKSKAAGEDMPVHFFVAGEDPIVERVKGFIGAAASDPVILIDIPSQKVFRGAEISEPIAINTDNITAFVDKFIAGTLSGTQLG